ncbi:fimbrillin family protein [Bacteroides hominis]|uniref:fimbrillin family protein n=1 Tax=Bacteroides hominis TaxID=2763023 RepID=UPI00164BF8AB|nr:fimbrillin family protein [Bacteroides hominis (ex Liu et al. 2022)]MBC5614552.1 fimbrillin family protein [Bacteroides hominis (ex Liu et al. 2022)]
MTMNVIRSLTTLCALAGAVCLASCSSDEEVNVSNDGRVLFTAGIGNQAVAATPATRASGSAWASGDAIGIFMVGHGTVDVEAGNKKFITLGGNGTFTPVAGNEIYYPMDNIKVDFIAYYPYKENVSFDADLPVTIATDQTATDAQPGCDLMWAKADKNGNGYTKDADATTPVALTFGHCLAKLRMNCTVDVSVGVTLDAATVTISGMNTVNTFDLTTGTLGTPETETDITPRKLATPTANFAATYDAIILPGNYGSNKLSVTFKINGEDFIWQVAAIEFEPGKEYIYEVIIKRTGVSATGTITPWGPVDKGQVNAE